MRPGQHIDVIGLGPVFVVSCRVGRLNAPLVVKDNEGRLYDVPYQKVLGNVRTGNR